MTELLAHLAILVVAMVAMYRLGYSAGHEEGYSDCWWEERGEAPTRQRRKVHRPH